MRWERNYRSGLAIGARDATRFLMGNINRKKRNQIMKKTTNKKPTTKKKPLIVDKDKILKGDYRPRADELSLADMARWMDNCAKTARICDEGRTPAENRFLTADIRRGYKRIAQALRAYEKMLNAQCNAKG